MQISTAVTLKDSFKGNLTISYSGSLKIPEGTSVTIDGNVRFSNSKADNEIENYGELVITGSFYNYSNPSSGYNPYTYNYNKLTINGSINDDDGYHHGYIYQNTDSAVLTVGGNVSFSGSERSQITKGTVVFNGTSQQTVENLSAPIIILENKSEDGVVFSTVINPSTLFNHKGNQFTLTSNSTFVDYDGDGLKDNVDPEPTVGLPCTITVITNNDEYGTVSSNTIETIGGTTNTITATPGYKYTFVKWVNEKNAVLSTNQTYSFVAKESETITAIFERNKQLIIAGDVNGDEVINDQDAIYYLFSIYFPEEYPMEIPSDFNGDGIINDQDAIYLLFYVYFPDKYPIE